MEILYSELDNGIRMIMLIGALDAVSKGEIETKFSGYCAGRNVRVVVDLSEVGFLAFIGIRLLTSTAKSVANQGGRMAIVNPIPEVQYELEAIGIPEFIPMCSHLESAETVLMAT